VIVVLFTTVTAVAALPPNVTVAPERKFVPEIVTLVPPAVVPAFGETPVTVGVGTAYVKPLARLPLCPLSLTVTVTEPAEFAGVVAVIVVLLATVTFVAAAVPNVTVAPETKLVPVMVTLVPPTVVPVFGETPVTVGVGTAYVNPLARLPLWPFSLTVTLRAPAALAGVVAVIVVLLVTETFVAGVVPKVTAAPATKFVPVIVTLVPPRVDPVLGLTLVTVGAGDEPPPFA